MTEKISLEKLKEIPTVEFAVDISNPTMKVYSDIELTAEIDTKSLTKEQWEKMLGHIPIVRCKYCYFGKQNDEIVECGLLGIKRLGDDFCSDGRL